MSELTRLQREVADHILEVIHQDELAAGAKLNENSLAKRLNVSRTPVRAALAHLADQGIVSRSRDQGVEVIKPPSRTVRVGTPETEELLLVRIARDRENAMLPDEISEIELMRRYGLGRPEVQRTLGRLSDLNLVERKPGYGWRFLSSSEDARIYAEGYRFRILIEPLGILENGFQIEKSWLAEMRHAHEQVMTQPWEARSSIPFFEMNAAFHEGIASASGNRFIASAIRRQNQLRRLSNYDWEFGFERVLVNCREHIAIIDYLATGENEVAASLMRSHLMRAQNVRRPGKAAAVAE